MCLKLFPILVDKKNLENALNIPKTNFLLQNKF